MWFSTRWFIADRFVAASVLAAALLFATTAGARMPDFAASELAGHAGSDAAARRSVLALRYIDDAQLAGTGTLTWFGFRIYEAALFTPRDFDPRRPYAHPFVLELTYARDLSGAAIAAASHDEIKRLDLGDEARRNRWYAQMARLFPDVVGGERLAGVFEPGAPVRFYLNDRFIGAIDDREFARAFFAIWFDERTRAPRLRDNLFSTLAAGRRSGS